MDKIRNATYKDNLKKKPKAAIIKEGQNALGM